VNHFAWVACLVVFAGLPPALLAWRWQRPQSLPWHRLLAITAISSWLLSNAAVFCYFEYLNEIVEAQDDPLPELLDRLITDGPKRVFALFFGWAYGLAYLVPCGLVFRLMRGRQGT